MDLGLKSLKSIDPSLDAPLTQDTSVAYEIRFRSFRMPPTCPERSEGSSQIRGLAPRSLRALALRDPSLALSRQRLIIDIPKA